MTDLQGKNDAFKAGYYAALDDAVEILHLVKKLREDATEILNRIDASEAAEG